MKGTAKEFVFMAAIVLGLGFTAGKANAQSTAMYSKGDWVLAVNATRVLTDETLESIKAGGVSVPGAALSISNDTTLSFDISRFLNESVALNFLGGIPAVAGVDGRGTIAGLGQIAITDYGPAIFSVQYHFPVHERFMPYVGGGVARILFLNGEDGALGEFDVEDAWAPAMQIGARFKARDDWFVNFDVRYAPFKTDISGFLGGAPAEATVEVKPLLISLGVAHRF